MKIPINEFEQYIDETILKRGLSYFKDGNVQNVELINIGEYEAIVEGSEDYNVQLTLKNGIITEHVCDCPYDMGPVCKHVAAVIFHLQKEKLGLEKKPAKKKTTKSTTKTKKSKTISGQIVELLEKISHDELKKFIIDNTSKNKDLRSLFLSSFAQYNVSESKEFYVKQIKAIISSVSGRYKFIDNKAGKKLISFLEKILEIAQKHIDNKNYKSAFFICTAIIEEVVDVLDDTENSDITDSIEEAVNKIEKITEEPIKDNLRKEIMKYCLSAFDENISAGWEWHTDILYIASLLVKTEKEMIRFFKSSDKKDNSEITQKISQKYKYDVLQKIKGDKEADEYLKQNISNSYLREIAIHKALKEKKYKKAIVIAKNGIANDKEKSLQTVILWHTWLLRIAQEENETEKIIEYAQYLFVQDYHLKEGFYKILKENVKPEDWNTFVEKLVVQIKAKKGWGQVSFISEIYIKEEWWDKLWELVKDTKSLETIEFYEKYLAKDYAKEIIELYSKFLVIYLENNKARNYYQNACRYLRRIIKLGGREKSNELIEYFREEYPKRKALMEELDNV